MYSTLIPQHPGCPNSSLPTNSPLHTATLMDTSFEQTLGIDHARAIKQAYQTYLNNSLPNWSIQPDCFAQGPLLNSEYESMGMEVELDLQSVIVGSRMLTQPEAQFFITGLENNVEIKGLVEAISQLFVSPLMDELLYVVYQIWRYYLEAKQASQSQPLINKITPYRILTDIQSGPAPPKKSYKCSQEISKMICYQLTKNGQQLFHKILLNPSLISINLTHLKQQVTINENVRHYQLMVFLKNVHQAVFMCCEGLFCHHHQDSSSQSGNLPIGEFML